MSLTSVMARPLAPVMGLKTQAQDALRDPLTVAKSVAKPVVKIGTSIKKLKDAHDDWDGEDKRYNLNAGTGLVETQRDHNHLTRELAKDNLEKGLVGMSKGIGAGLKGSSGIMGVVDPLMEAINPVANAGKIVKGGTAVGKGIADIKRFQDRKSKAREHQEKAEARGDMLALGLRGTKRGLSEARNEAMVNTGLGALNVINGATGIGQMFDPTGITAGVNGALTVVNKVAKKGNSVRRAIKYGLREDKIERYRERAAGGDANAAEWLLENDPRSRSAQLLMHAQKGKHQDETQDAIVDTLGLEKDSKSSLSTASLADFDKLYNTRTGTQKLKGVEKFIAKKAVPIAKKLKSAGGWIKNKVMGPKAPKAPGSMAALSEYHKVHDFRVDKTYEELIDKAEQKSLGARAKGEGDGSLFNIDDHRGLSSQEAIEKTELATQGGKMDPKKSAKRFLNKNKAGKGMFDEDIMQGLIDREDKRRAGNAKYAGASSNMFSGAPVSPTWQTDQSVQTKSDKDRIKDEIKNEKDAKKQQKEQEKAAKLQLKEQEKAEKARLAKEKKEQEKAAKLLKKGK